MKIKCFTLFSWILLSSLSSGAKSPLSTLEASKEHLESWRQELEITKNLSAREKDLRQEFTFRLRFLLQSSEGEKKIRNEVKNEAWPLHFRTQLEKVLEEDMEPQQNIILFLKDFVDKVTFTSPPLEVSQFQLARSYFDGRRSLNAEPLDLESAGDEAALILEQKEALAFPDWYRPISPTLTP
jgi:hypothetical protein